MAQPSQEAIETFISITGADEAVAARKLEEHSGDLNEAVNAYFNEGDRSTTRINQNPIPDSHDDIMDLDEPFDPMFSRSMGNPFGMLDPSFVERAAAGFFGQGPQVTHPRDVRQIPIEVKDNDNPQIGSSGQGPVIEDVTGHESLYGLEVHGTVVIDEDDDDLPSTHAPVIPRNTPSTYNSAPSAPPLVNVSDYNNDIEEEMIRAAIEASKRDAEGLTNVTERERVLLQEGMHAVDNSSDLSDKEDIEGASEAIERQVLTTGQAGTSRQLVDEENFQDDTEDVDEEPLVRQRSRRALSGTAGPTEAVQRADSPPSGPQPHATQNAHQHNGAFPSEWGGISSEEHDEAVMLEAAMFGGIPEHTEYPFPLPSHGISTGYPRVAHPPSPTLTAQRLLREQQDDEYLAALQADREKELKAVEDAELRRLEEVAAREAAIEMEKQKNEEKLRKQLEEEELESMLAAKRASLPKEPLPNAEGAVTVVVRMPDGSRQGRRFLKSDQLQALFDFIDISKTFKPGTYRLEQLHEREKYILELEMNLDDTHRELDALKIDHQTVWANQDLLREQTKEIASFRRERDNSEAERAQHLKQIHDLQEHLREKESQYLALEEQHRVAQDNILYKDEQLRDAHAWITRVQEMDILQSQSLQAELRERTDQFGQCWATFQQQYVEMQQGFLHTIQRLQLELIELRDRTGEQEDVSQAAQEASGEASYGQSKGSNMSANGSALADGNQSTNDSFKGNNAHAVPVVPPLLGLSGFVPPGQMAGMHSYMLHPQGIPQSLASPNSGVPQFGTFQPTVQPTLHWPNQQEAQAASQTPDATNYHPSQSDQNALQPAASNNVELSSGQSQVTHPENLTAHGEQEQRSTSVVAESTHEPKVMESNVTEHFYNEEQKAQDSSSNASSTGKFERQEERSESKGEKVASGKQPVEHVPGKQNQASDSAGSTTQIHMNNMSPELKSNVVNQSDTVTSAGGGVGSLLPKDPVLLDERSLLACIVRAVPAGSDNRIRISSTLPNRLGKMLAPLHWHDYKKNYGKLDDFVASHNELFVIEGDFIHLREGAQQIISATTAAAKIAAAAAAASSASYSSLLPSVAVTPVAHTTRHKRGPVVDSRSSNSMPSGNGSTTAKYGNQHQANGFSDEVRAGQSSRHTAAANGGRHERVGPSTHEKVPSARHGYGGKQQGRSAGTEFSSRR